MIHSFLLIGQSNAAGRGILKDAPALDTNKGMLKVQRNGRWQTMFRPVNPDRPFSGTCLAESFAKAYSDDNAGIEVGIIPAADGGTTLDQWQPCGLLFDNAVNCARLAMRTSTLVGILWHQGEGDCGEDKYPLYEEKFTAIKDALRDALGLPNIPIIIGGLGDFLADRVESPQLINYPKVNEALQSVAKKDNNCAFVSAVGLGSNPDNLHFSHEALHEFGLRYYSAFKALCPKVDSSAEVSFDDSKRSEMELL